jgi:hypothetical protein
MSVGRDTFVIECLLRLTKRDSVNVIVVSDTESRWAHAAQFAASMNGQTCRTLGVRDWPQGSRATIAVIDSAAGVFKHASAALDDAECVIVMLRSFDSILEPWEHLGIVAACWPTPDEPGAVVLSRAAEDRAGMLSLGREAGVSRIDPIAAKRQLIEETRATAHAQAAALSAIRGSHAYRFAKRISQSRFMHKVDRALHPHRRWTTVRVLSGELIVRSIHESSRHPAMPWDFVHLRGDWHAQDSVTVPRVVRGLAGSELRFTAHEPMIVAMAHATGGEIEIELRGLGANAAARVSRGRRSLRSDEGRLVVMQPWSEPG